MPRLLALACLLGAAAARAQAPAEAPRDTTARAFGTSAALAILLTEDGLGVGGAGRTALSPDLSFVFEASLGAARDAREQQFFTGLFGETVTPFKRNYVALVPLHAGLERRLLRRQVEDNFRPFVVATLGPTLAVQWPYFDDRDADGVRADDEERLGVLGGLDRARLRLGVGGTLAVGVAVGSTTRTAQSLRFGVSGHAFPGQIDLLELEPEIEDPSRTVVWTPVVSFHVLRLLR